MILTNLFIITSFSYFTLILWLINGFEKIKEFNGNDENDENNFSIIIPFRNEAINLIELIKSLNKIDYNKVKFEIIFVNDNSNDNSVKIIKQNIDKDIQYKIIDNVRYSNSPKKDAIELAIKKSKNDWIVTTDADCIVNKNWLRVINSFIIKENEIEFIASPVKYKINNTFIYKFQRIDFLSLIGSTIGGFGNNKPIMCNGANLCYRKETFLKIDGYNDNNKIASGDDVFLLEKMLKYNRNGVKYLKSINATVVTKPENSIKELIQQRIRWASKTSKIKMKGVIITGLVVILFNLLITYTYTNFFISTLNFRTINDNLMILFSVSIILKIIIDYFLINKTAMFFNENVKIKTYIPIAFLYPIFTSVIFILSLTKKYKWKERVFNK
jgi:cellulose synthase/poly-beta-1,6-N-acetylglucosamine synthase-like glycosyltransferase